MESRRQIGVTRVWNEVDENARKKGVKRIRREFMEKKNSYSKPYKRRLSVSQRGIGGAHGEKESKGKKILGSS